MKIGGIGGNICDPPEHWVLKPENQNGRQESFFLI